MDDELFEALADERRRRILLELYENGAADAPVLVPEDVTAGEESMGTVHLDLYHNHLPKLVEGDLVEWDRERDAVEMGAAFGRVEPVLQLLSETECLV